MLNLGAYSCKLHQTLLAQHDESMKRLILILPLLFCSHSASAEPSHFPDVIGSALLCRDQVSSEYFNEYMTNNFGKSEYSYGGANWWKINGKLFNSKIEYIFVGENYNFIGATFADEPDKLMAKIKSAIGMNYKQAGAEKWVSPNFGVIIKYNDNAAQSKMFCVGSPSSPSVI
jgi:hypothetical protein